MQLFSADAKIFFKKNSKNFLPPKTKKQPPTEKVLKFNMIFHNSTRKIFFQKIKIKLNSRT